MPSHLSIKEKNIIINSKNIFEVYLGETNVDEFDFTTRDAKKIAKIITKRIFLKDSNKIPDEISNYQYAMNF